MTRVKWVQTLIFVGVAVSMAGAFAVGVRAMQDHNHCLNGCGPNQKPGKDKCCEPPDCEFDYQLTVNTAKVRSIALAKKQGKFGPGASQYTYNGPSAAQIAAFTAQHFGGSVGPKQVAAAKTSSLKSVAGPFDDCIIDKPFIQDPPFVVDTGNCTVTQNGSPIDMNDPNTLNKAKDAAKQCREAVEADWYRAATLVAVCNQNNGLSGLSLQEAEQQASEAAQRSMQEQLSQFIQSCKPFDPKFKSARDAVKKATNMLKGSGSKPIPQNKRQFSGRSKKPGHGRGK